MSATKTKKEDGDRKAPVAGTALELWLDERDMTVFFKMTLAPFRSDCFRRRRDNTLPLALRYILDGTVRSSRGRTKPRRGRPRVAVRKNCDGEVLELRFTKASILTKKQSCG